ncbi:MAG: hypothetical protein MJ248_02175 [Bacilli bacterium]|nr:hypothetical protein [Bacilli bacterium]
MKKLSLLTLPLLAIVLSGCSGKGPVDPDDDPTKVTIKVGTLALGYGSEWLNKAASSYEEMHKDDVFGEKKGVKVVVVPTTDSLYPRDGSSVLSDDIDVHFRENMNVDKLIRDGAIMDLTSALNYENPYDGKSIVSKMYDDDIALYTSNGKTYATSFTSGSYGIVYNKKLFASKKLYIAKDSPENATSTSQVKLIATKGAKKSAGYNGIEGDYDDGLPRTYIEFKKVLEACVADGNTVPLGWSPKYAESYVINALTGLMMSDAGYEQAKIRLSFDGKATTLGQIVGSTFVKDKSPTTITNGKDGNGYEMYRSSMYYNSLSWLDMVLSNKNFYMSQEVPFDHYALQDYMINGYEDKQVAMCVEGSWFYNECAKHINKEDLDEYDFGFMPLPKSSFTGVTDRKYTYLEQTESCAFIKGNIADENKRNVAVDFLQYFYSDTGILNFSKETKALIGVKYPDLDVTSQDYIDLGSFGQDIYNMTKTSNRLSNNYPNQFLLNNKKEIGGIYYFRTKDTTNPLSSFLNNSHTPASYVQAMISNFNETKWGSLS